MPLAALNGFHAGTKIVPKSIEQKLQFCQQNTFVSTENQQSIVHQLTSSSYSMNIERQKIAANDTNGYTPEIITNSNFMATQKSIGSFLLFSPCLRVLILSLAVKTH